MILTDEQRRILMNRIVKAVEDARYYPAKSRDAQAVATQVLRAPFAPDPHNSGKSTTPHACS